MNEAVPSRKLKELQESHIDPPSGQPQGLKTPPTDGPQILHKSLLELSLSKIPNVLIKFTL